MKYVFVVNPHTPEKAGQKRLYRAWTNIFPEKTVIMRSM